MEKIIKKKYIEWNNEAEEAVVKLKRVLSEQITLIFPYFEKNILSYHGCF